MSPPSLLVVGLGNPGPDYEHTRHNVGFRVADALAERLDVSYEHTDHALVGMGEHRNRKVGVAKPTTYMNRSGTAVASLLHRYDLPLDQLLVVVDDLHLPIGTLRLRPSGSSGGHNGLAHIAECLDSTDYPRLRVGIGNEFPDGQQVDYVLSPFTAQQQPLIREAIQDACDAVLTVVRDDLTTAMNQFN